MFYLNLFKIYLKMVLELKRYQIFDKRNQMNL